MFDELIKELKKLEGEPTQVTVSATFEPDEDGYLDRQCADARCDYAFKIHDDDWARLIQGQGQAYCPRCRCKAGEQSWFTHEQVKHLQNKAVNTLSSRLGRAMKQDALHFNRRQPRGGFITMSMKVDGRPKVIPLPKVAEVLQVRITCDQCSCRFAVIGTGYFCPACGADQVSSVFGRSIGAVKNGLANLDAIRGAIPDRDLADDTVRNIVEGSLQNLVAALQRYLDRLYENHTGNIPPKHAFQRLIQGSELWKAETGQTYENLIGATELARLTRYFQQRHLLAHRQGVVDAEYIQKSGDTSYQTGQRLVVKDNDVQDAAILVERLGKAIKSKCGAV